MFVYEQDADGMDYKYFGLPVRGLHEGEELGESVALSGDGKRVATGSRDGANQGRVRVFEMPDEGEKLDVDEIDIQSNMRRTGGEWKQLGSEDGVSSGGWFIHSHGRSN